MSGQIVHFLLELRNQLKIYHWQTYSYPQHKATDDVIQSLDEHIDLFVEVWMGKYGRFKLTKMTGEVLLKNMSERSILKFIHESILYLQGPLTKVLKGTDTDLANIRDEMIADLNKLLYLFTLK